MITDMRMKCLSGFEAVCFDYIFGTVSFGCIFLCDSFDFSFQSYVIFDCSCKKFDFRFEIFADLQSEYDGGVQSGV